ncbi:hypothetical protein L1987_11502 [Smallanthus sonchifolius]|uniref:Uncharacterized protein n=1 Tax=Smallanthus sonchifolius TaxID=185202 RepID=A0ACB9JB70_9ASTR|nr:hypothetical protein L1987_11502 [Smallanthus sonchifolius]
MEAIKVGMGTETTNGVVEMVATKVVDMEAIKVGMGTKTTKGAVDMVATKAAGDMGTIAVTGGMGTIKVAVVNMEIIKNGGRGGNAGYRG